MEGLLEFKVLGILRKKENYLKYKAFVKQELFKTPELQLIFKTIVKYHEKYDKQVISIKNLRLLVERSVAADELSNYIPLIRKVKQSNLEDDEVIRDCVIKFAQGKLIREIAQDLLYAIERDPDSLNLEDLRGKLNDAISLNDEGSIPDWEYLSNDHDRFALEAERLRIPTGLSTDLDTYIGGGLASGELGIILAPTGRGKTLGLVNLGATALRLGKRVLHVTLEIKSRVVSRRYDLRIARRTFEELRDSPEYLTQKLSELQSKGAKLLIQDFSYRHGGTHNIDSTLDRHRNKGEPFDLVVIDYADLLDPPTVYKEKRFAFADIYKELRILAGKYDIPIWTASQGNRKSMDKRVVNMQDFNESIDKAFTADVVITMCQTPEEKEELMMRLFIAKQRSGSKNPIIPVLCDPDRMLIKPYKREEKDEDSSGRPRAISDRSSPYRRPGVSRELRSKATLASSKEQGD